MENLQSLSFNIWNYKESELVSVCLQLFQETLAFLGISHSNFQAFLEEVQEGYHKVLTYHNFYHAVDVTQFVYILSKNKTFEQKMNNKEKLALMISALCHDIGHGGKDNHYHVTHKTELFQEFGPVSPMEKFHLQKTFLLVEKYWKVLFPNTSKKESEEIKKLISTWILSTDIFFHQQWKEQIEAEKDLSTTLLGVLAIKAADLSQILRNDVERRAWAEKIFIEFFLLEKEKDPKLTEEVYAKSFEEGQKKFILNVCIPFFQLVKEKTNFRPFKKKGSI